MTTKPLTVTDETFDQEVLQSDVPVLVDIWAPWCSPCRTLEPMIEELADTYDGRVKVAKLNVDENTGVARRLSLAAIPTLLFYRGGELEERTVGIAPRAALAEKLDALLAVG